MKTNRFFPALLICLLLLVISACPSPINISGPDGAPTTGVAKFRLRIVDASSRTVLPTTAGLIQSFVITLSRVGYDPVVQVIASPFPAEGASLSGLDYGSYTLLVEGKNAAAGSGDTVASNGTGQALEINAAMVEAQALVGYLLEGVGNVSISFSWPSLTSLTSLGASWDGGSFSTLSVGSSGGTSTALFSLTDTPAGLHNLAIRFQNASGQSIGGDLETRVWVFHRATSSHVWTLTENDFISAPSAPTNLSAVPASGGVALQWTDNSLFEREFIVERRALGQTEWSLVSETVSANATSFLDQSFSAAATSRFEYRLAARNPAGTSSWVTASGPVNPAGFIHPGSGSFAPVDSNGASAGLGWASSSWPLGANFSGSDLELAVYSKHATRIMLEIYSVEHAWVGSSRLSGYPSNSGHALYEYWMEKGSDDVWRAKISNTASFESSGLMYAFRAWGPNWPWNDAWTRGNSSAGFVADWQSSGYPPVMYRFNPNKVLYDPYARELSQDTEYPALASGGESGGIYGTGGASSLTWGGANAGATYSGSLSTGGLSVDRRTVDTGRFCPKGYALNLSNYAGARPNIPEKDIIVYEAQLRGLTRHESSSRLQDILADIDSFSAVANVPAAYRGTYRGAAYLAPYFEALGINALELLPVQETRNDMNDSYSGTGNNPGNYWGYMTYGYFAPDRNYAYDKSPGGPSREFQAMVAAFAAEGVEVWTDVVYNHSGEGGNWGGADSVGFTSLGGFGASEYYHINPDNGGGLVDGATGCGNQLNFSEGRSVTQALVTDSLRHWIDVLGVSGFRFDLAAVLARDIDSVSYPNPSYWDDVKGVKASSGVINHSLPLAIAALGSSKAAKMVAETWDLWAYPVGMYPAGWMEWNGRYRDATRRFLNWGNTDGHDGLSVNDAFHGDYSHYNDNGGPQKSVNFIVAHDGLTLADLVSYNVNTPAQRDAINTSLTWPFGPSDGGSGDNISTDSGADASLRRQRLRSLSTWQIFGRGTPMIVWGDEFGRTQNGNNNPYNLDSVATYNNYDFINRNAPQTAPTGVSGASYNNNLGTDSKADGLNNLFLFNAALMNLRKNEPALRSADYNVVFAYASESGGAAATDARARRIHIQGSGISGGSDYVLCVNMWTATVSFTLPTPPSGKIWKRVIDTAAWAENQADSDAGNLWLDADAWTWDGLGYGVNPWAIAVFKAL